MVRTVRRSLLSLAGGVIPGAIAGLFCFGAGSRLAMRVMAMTSDADGMLTEAGEIVGRITLGGTMFLILAGTVIGALGGVVYLCFTRWIPGSGALKGLAFGTLLLALFGRAIIDPGNVDFEILDPAGLAVAMFAAMFVLYGLLFVPIYERLGPRIRRASGWFTAAALIPMVPLVLTGIFGVALVLFAAGAILATRVPGILEFWNSRIVSTVGYVALTGAFILGAGSVFRAAATIL